MLLPHLRALSLARALRRRLRAANREPSSSSGTHRSLSGGSCLSRSCLCLGLVRVSGLRPPRLHRRSLQLLLPNRRRAFNSTGSLPSDFPPAFLNAVPPAQLDSPSRLLRRLAPFGACRRFCRFCVSIRAGVSVVSFLRFPPQRQAAVAFPAFHWPLSRCPRETMPEPIRTLHRPAVPGCVPDLLRIFLPAACAHRTIFRSRSEPSSSCAGRKCSLPIRYWATN